MFADIFLPESFLIEVFDSWDASDRWTQFPRTFVRLGDIKGRFIAEHLDTSGLIEDIGALAGFYKYRSGDQYNGIWLAGDGSWIKVDFIKCSLTMHGNRNTLINYIPKWDMENIPFTWEVRESYRGRESLLMPPWFSTSEAEDVDWLLTNLTSVVDDENRRIDPNAYDEAIRFFRQSTDSYSCRSFYSSRGPVSSMSKEDPIAFLTNWANNIWSGNSI